MKNLSSVPFSVLDLAPVPEGSGVADALRNTLDLARRAEALSFRRFWLAEHHNMTGIASAATAVLVGHVAGGTRSIRVGSGGVMLPNHSPLVIAEQFGTLEALHPGRIDLGLGRAPGTDQLTMRALRRNFNAATEDFPRDVQELRAYFAPARADRPVRAVPGAGLGVPLWLLGSSLYSAQLAAELGLPFAFASHFAPDYLMHALEVYRERFRPSSQLKEPYAMACLNVFAAETDEEARRLFTSVQQAFVNLRRGRPGKLPPPVETLEGVASEPELAGAGHALRYSVVGSPETVRRGLEAFLALTGADELMMTSQIHDHAARLRSLEIAAAAREGAAANAK
ncbi:MAG: LLM class flavin-dependent oxidoreductase [Acidobacteria bacterium]|nr:LLM class flavin-dependent oxidoreductase [Acidobacteriota bacterium]MCA1620397.1 LLM class flavin-dependent oxidoreductase [Acidobacteriota bacterium]